MEGVTSSRKKLAYLLGDDNLDDQMYREQGTAPTRDPCRPSARVGSQVFSRARAKSTDAEMNQGFSDPGSCNMSGGNPSTFGQEPRVAAHRRLRSGVATRTSLQRFMCKSPSTDSTTSLLQLRDRLTFLSPLLFNKVPHKIATSPELPVLNEFDEDENLSNSLANIKLCRDPLKYHSDSEAQALSTDKKRKEFLEGFYKDIDLADLLVAEALQHGQEKDSGILSGKVTQVSDVVENTPVEKEVQHKQLSIKYNAKSNVQDEPAFNESDVEVIEDTPCYSPTSIKCNAKSNVQDEPAFNESDDEVIEDTPCYSPTSIKCNAKSNVQDEPAFNESDDEVIEDTPCYSPTSIKCNAKSNVQDEPAFNESDDEVIEDIPCYSPTLGNKINETSSEASDDDCIIVRDHFMEEELSSNSLVFEADIVDCVNSVTDKVCNDLINYKCAELLAEQERHIDNLRFVKNTDDNSNISSDIFKTSKDKFKSDKDAPYEHNTEGTEKVTLKFKQSKKVTPKMNTRKKKTKNDKDQIDLGQSNVLVESTNTSSPLNSIKVTLTQKKRKLYSHKGDENENKEITTPKTRVERRQSNINETSIATCYRELEKARQSHSRISKKSRASIQAKKSKKSCYNMSSESDGEDPSFQTRKCYSSSSIGSITTMSRRERSMKMQNYYDAHYSTMHSSSGEDDFEHNRTIQPKTARKIKPRSRKVAITSKTQPILSPKTKKINEMFDKIKENVVNDEKITLVEKKSVEKKLSLYNLSSESEDEDFKKTNNQVNKRIRSSSIESSATKRRRLTNRVKYSKYYSSEDQNKGTQKSKTVKQAKPRSRKRNKIPKFNLIDERMRAPQEETFDTSFVKDTVDTNILEEPEPALQHASVLEDMSPDKSNDDETEDVLLENKTQTPKKLAISKINKTCEKVTRSIATKKAKEITKIESKETDNAPLSPLPGLVVETEKTRQDDFTSSIEANLLQKFKKIYTDGVDLNQTDATRHLLLNADENDDAVLEPAEVIETTHVSDVLSERSIATGGRSPITGHNNLNESPPNVGLLDEDFQHRDVHNEGMTESMAEFLTNMRNQLQTNKPTVSLTSPVIPIIRMSTKESALSNLCAKRMSSEESILKSIAYAESNKSNPKVVLERIPTKKIESKLDPIGSPKSKVSSVVLTRISSEEIEKYMPPTSTKKTSDIGSPKVVLKRISSEEIDRWLPMPESKDVVDTGETPKKYKTRQTSKPTETKIPTKRETSRPAANVIENKIKPNIPPVKLTFDIGNLTMSAGDRVRRALRTQSSTKSTKSHATNIDKEPLKTVSTTQTRKNDHSFIKNSQVTSKSSVVTRSKPDKASADRCDVNPSIAIVQDWLQRNNTPSSPSAADNHTTNEIVCQVMESLQTTLTEIHQVTGERLTAAFLKNQEETACLEKEVQGFYNRFQKKIAGLKKHQMDRACEVIRDDAQKKARMVELLQEDIQRLLNQD